MAEYNVTVAIGGVRIKPNDIIFGDINGIVVIPSDHQELVFAELHRTLEGEKNTEAGLLSGKGAQEVFGEFNTF